MALSLFSIENVFKIIIKKWIPICKCKGHKDLFQSRKCQWYFLMKKWPNFQSSSLRSAQGQWYDGLSKDQVRYGYGVVGFVGQQKRTKHTRAVIVYDDILDLEENWVPPPVHHSRKDGGKSNKLWWILTHYILDGCDWWAWLSLRLWRFNIIKRSTVG